MPQWIVVVVVLVLVVIVTATIAGARRLQKSGTHTRTRGRRRDPLTKEQEAAMVARGAQFAAATSRRVSSDEESVASTSTPTQPRFNEAPDENT